ncbi:glycine betaine ABC transporter substrate-binding protein [Thalassobacillus sp. CUG 92003]|uniref:glycine betaine ABC transporter substrate-binding protein n=1 Tax=Thalassobacillus sp. CUG 92003 TaxID=2736641 RepID=UPI0015E6B5BC|nr:glycine betaine ABC transporter substrate-binding protein [Thalassobacillus sp. CUG 92003]
MKNVFRLTLTLLLSTVLLTACGGSGGASGDKEVTIGSKSFTEQLLLSKMTAMLLEDNGFSVEEKNNMGSNVLRSALESKQVDMAWDYTGTGLVTYLDEDPVPNAEEAFERVKEIDKENGIDWVNLSEINNTYTIMMRQKQSEEIGITKLSELAEYMNNNSGEMTLATDVEFSERPDGLDGLEEFYGFEYGADQVETMDLGLTYESLQKKQVDTAVGFATDSRIEDYNLVNLEDDKQFFPDYTAAVVINEGINEEYPEIAELTAGISDNMNSDTMRKLNYQVDIEEKSVKDVAEQWLTDQGLIE